MIVVIVVVSNVVVANVVVVGTLPDVRCNLVVSSEPDGYVVGTL